jgi:hypothetical protein
MEEVVPPRRDVAVEATVAGAPDTEALQALAAVNNLDGPITRLLAAFGDRR